VIGIKKHIYDVGKFAELLLAGNPTCLEVLFLSRDSPSVSFLYESPHWHILKQAKHDLMTSQALHKTLGFLNEKLQQSRQAMHNHGLQDALSFLHTLSPNSSTTGPPTVEEAHRFLDSLNNYCDSKKGLFVEEEKKAKSLLHQWVWYVRALFLDT